MVVYEATTGTISIVEKYTLDNGVLCFNSGDCDYIFKCNNFDYFSALKDGVLHLNKLPLIYKNQR